MSGLLKAEVLQCFRALHRTRKNVFCGDSHALQVSSKKIREEFQKHKNEQDDEKIKELLKVGWDTEMLIRTTIIQAKLNEKGNYELKITKDTAFLDNSKS